MLFFYQASSKQNRMQPTQTDETWRLQDSSEVFDSRNTIMLVSQSPNFLGDFFPSSFYCHKPYSREYAKYYAHDKKTIRYSNEVNCFVLIHVILTSNTLSIFCLKILLGKILTRDIVTRSVLPNLLILVRHFDTTSCL